MAVKVSIDGEGLKFEGETSLHKAAQVIAFLGVEHVDVIPGTARTESMRTLVSAPATGRTPRQIIDQSSAKSNPQKIAAVGLYFKERGQDVFSRAEIAEQFRRAGEQIPKNLGRDLKDAVRAGFICESEGQRDEFYITNEAETQISQGFSSSTPSGARVRHAKTKTKKASSGVPEPLNVALKEITFVPVVEGLPQYWDIKKGDRILWILQVAKDNSVGQLDSKDIEYVAKVLDDNIPGSNVNALSEVNRKRSYLHKNGNIYSILGPGMTYLKTLIKKSPDEV